MGPQLAESETGVTALRAGHRGVDGSWRLCAALSLAALVVGAQELSAAGHAAFGRHAPAHKSASVWAAAPVAEVPIAPQPQVARPTDALGDCDFVQRFLIGNEVLHRRTHVIAVSLLGGLYGP